IENCKLGLVNLSGNEARDMIFRSCVIDELDVSEARLTRISFEESSVKALDVHRANLTDVDLRDLRVNVVRNLGGLSGATITA
ncbi:pentapeptide repeat-containing protein, partial [Mycobacterium tuberculosis]|nr:pentapeptide repeat-containing protein [Mycobacterium tuberculosis]